MNEEFLIYIWQYQLIDQNLSTIDGDPVTVIKVGDRNTDSGPDFFNARIKIGKTTWAGNIEIHIKSSDWYLHHHENDPAFDNIVLHIVYDMDKPVFRKNGENIPTLELKNNFDKNTLLKYRDFLESNKWIACQDLIATVPYFDMIAYLDKLMIERLELKAESINKELKNTKQDFQEVFYQKLLRNFGFKINEPAMELLAKSIPLKILAKHANRPHQTEALLFGQAGMLIYSFKDEYPNLLKSEYQFLSAKYHLGPIDPKLWKFMRLHPANFPTIRIAQFACMIGKTKAELNKILEADKLSDIVNLFKVGTSTYWETHFRFDAAGELRKKRLGVSSIDLLLINTIIPFMFVFAQYKNDIKMQDKALSWLEQIKPENNNVIRKFKSNKINPINAMQSQALLQLKSRFCDEKRCLECRIGHYLINN